MRGLEVGREARLGEREVWYWSLQSAAAAGALGIAWKCDTALFLFAHPQMRERLTLPG